MKILVFSDSHGAYENINKAVEEHEANTNLIIHLGDGKDDMDYVSSFFPQIPCISLNGNRESYKDDSRIVDLEGIKALCMHGHCHGVKSSRIRAVYAALEKEASIVLYGHTHIQDNSSFITADGKKVRLFNPGSIGFGSSPSYGIINISNGHIVLRHNNL